MNELEFIHNYSDEGDAKLISWPCDRSKIDIVPVYDRPYEYAYTVAKFYEHRIRDRIILDVGSAGSVLPGILIALGNDVICMDVREWPIQMPRLNVIKGDLLKADPLISGFDMITCISTIEHFGLGRYGDKQDVNGDIKGMLLLRQYLKPSGWMILTTTYGVATVAFPAHRIYNASRFSKLTAGFKVLDKQFFGPIDRPDAFRPCSEEETYSVDTDGHYAIVCALLEKV